MLEKSVVIRALYQTLYRILNLKDGENPDDKKILYLKFLMRKNKTKFVNT